MSSSNNILTPKKLDRIDYKQKHLAVQSANPFLTVHFTTFDEKSTNSILGVYFRLKYQLDLKLPTILKKSQESYEDTSKKKKKILSREVEPEDFYKALGEVFNDLCFTVIRCSPNVVKKKNSGGTIPHFVQTTSNAKRKCLCFSFATISYVVMSNCGRSTK